MISGSCHYTLIPPTSNSLVLFSRTEFTDKNKSSPINRGAIDYCGFYGGCVRVRVTFAFIDHLKTHILDLHSFYL